MAYLISGIQQIGIGVPDVEAAWAFYRAAFGMDVPVFQDAAEAPLMTPYTGGTVHRRTATLALNLQGGSGFEIWQFTSRTPQGPAFDVQLGDLGLFAARIKTRDVAQAHRFFEKARPEALSPIAPNPAGTQHFFLTDPMGLTFDVVPGEAWFGNGRHPTGGPCGMLIGVSDVDRARMLYTDLLGYDEVVYDETGTFADFASLPGGHGRFRRVLLAHRALRRGPFARLLGPSRLELVQALDRTPRTIFEGRFWGDLGFIHLCFDVQGMDALKQACEAAGFPFTVDSADSFDMGEAAGRFGYIEDPDGTLIEFVETHRMPVLKKLGWYLDLRKRPHGRPLPDWMLKALALNRVRS
ncbi:glyoxalase [Rhodothermaceae bacterium RA]|nr:glyoxalase [Rhodothermaceae bacterium RA]